MNRTMGFVLTLVMFILGSFWFISRPKSSVSVRDVQLTALLEKNPLIQFDEKPLNIDSLINKPVLLHFWAEWCAPCREELPHLIDFATRNTGVTVLAVSLDESIAEAKKIAPLPVPPNVIYALDPKQEFAENLGSYQYPETYGFGPNGQLGMKWVGPQTWSPEMTPDVLNALK